MSLRCQAIAAELSTATTVLETSEVVVITASIRVTEACPISEYEIYVAATAMAATMIETFFTQFLSLLFDALRHLTPALTPRARGS
jgi:hypothetical protein